MSVGLSGKLTLIAVTVTAMAGGFSLGFFVGRNVPAPTAQPAVQMVLPRPAGPDVPVVQEDIKPQVPPPSSPSQTPIKDSGTTAGEVSRPEPQRPAASPRAGEETREAKKSDDPKAQSGPVYTVQAGAFKSRKEADALKADLEGKGLKARRQRVGQKGQTLYKITVGEFSEKKEAEVLALKLKKTKGLKAFVIIKN